MDRMGGWPGVGLLPGKRLGNHQQTMDRAPLSSPGRNWKTHRMHVLGVAPSVSLPRIRSPRGLIRRCAKWAFIASAVILLGYGLVVLYMLEIEPQLVFDPSRPEREWIDKPDACIQDLTLQTADGAMHAWYCPAEKPDAVMLLCHGNAGNLSIRGGGMLDYRRRFNASIMVFDYPGYGLSEGRPTEDGCYAAADAAYDWLVREKGFKPEQIILYGESLGGGVAVELASRRTVSALILVNTFANLPEVAARQYPWLPVTLLMRNRFDSEGKIGRCPAPIFLTHGTTDRLIPPDHSQRLLDQITAPRECLLREGKGHEDLLGSEVLDMIRVFLVQHGRLPGRN